MPNQANSARMRAMRMYQKNIMYVSLEKIYTAERAENAEKNLVHRLHRFTQII
jgi:hypothetical protein